MISASIALDQNRDVFAVPGSIHNSMSAGTHRLIQRSMAQIATGPEVILEELSLIEVSTEAPAVMQLSPEKPFARPAGRACISTTWPCP